ncbi:MAG: sugar transferase [Sphingobium sp.]|uniref:sugar transferase n=1 Tax=Sphingobium sp. TaxID=1912891 RepID=UPI0029AF567A|nr:sugar transferase [Sphingobium sp.]MDX3908918.1 sugar transferase [Sphingobium sp.]
MQHFKKDAAQISGGGSTPDHLHFLKPDQFFPSEKPFDGQIVPLEKAQSFPFDKQTTRIHLALMAVLLDTVAVYGGFSLGDLAHWGARAGANTKMIMLLTALFLMINFSAKAFNFHGLCYRVSGVRRSLGSLCVTVPLAVTIVSYIRPQHVPGPMALVAGTACSAVLLWLGRHAVDWTMRYVMPDGPTNKLVLCDGVHRVAKRGELVINTQEHAIYPIFNDPAMLDRIGQLARFADRIIVACPPERRQLWGLALKGVGIDTEVLLPELDALGPLDLQKFDGATTATITRGPMRLRDRVMKRAFDLAVVAVAIPLVLPLALLTALAIKLDDGGAILFAQRRVGHGNRLFRLYKFRSMRSELLDHDGKRSASRIDARVTRVGRLLRATSIDELPQLINVLLGDMSIVGPRPHAIASTAGEALFWDVDQRYWFRHAAKPGLTGLAQVRGFRGATASPNDLINRLQADLEYLSGWSLQRDLRIVLATFRVLTHRNAF